MSNDLAEILDVFFNRRPSKSSDSSWISITDKNESSQIGIFGKGSFPKTNIKTENNKLVFEMAIVGFDRQDMKVEVIDGEYLLVSGAKHFTDKKDTVYHLRELKYSSFSRVFKLPNYVDVQKVTSSFSNGLLQIVFEKRSSKQDNSRKEISIS